MPAAAPAQPSAAAPDPGVIDPELWPSIAPLGADAAVEARVDELLSRMSLRQKVGQVIQADSDSVTPEEVREYRLGSVLSGGNSAPGEGPYADVDSWLDAADAYYLASIDPDGVEVAIPTLWGIDAVHGHTNVRGGTVYPHNVGLGAARDPDLVRRIAAATARELRVTGHDWTFAPTLAVPQNDRWGRGYEGFSEDPAVVKSYGGAIVEGLQGEWGSDAFMGPGRVISTAKHFLGDGGTQDGVDQGDARISQQELRDVHLPGYETALAAGTQSVMASFSSWQGQPMHGQKALLTDVLKGRMNFDGFVIGDWNGHALIPGCTATDCPQSINAGLDMYMAPDTWRGLYDTTLAHVQSGTIPMERLDDAVRRILRVKVRTGLFEMDKPSARPLAGDTSVLGAPEHRALAREAVRKSAVLLKNDGALPIAPGSHIHVVGPAADSIAKFSGGWTLSWQGREHGNEEFPNGESFLQALTRAVEAAGGRVSTGDTVAASADVVLAVYGEDPYAEFQGDRDTVDFEPNDFDTARLASLGEGGTPVVSVFLSGRPLWTNPEINASDAFVAAFLPGSEPAGLVDLLMAGTGHDFTGRLSFSWPRRADQARLNERHPDYDPLFPVGYGLSYAAPGTVSELSEDSGLTRGGGDASTVFAQGQLRTPFALQGTETRATDWTAQEDALRVSLTTGDTLAVASPEPVDLSGVDEGAVDLVFTARLLSGAADVDVRAMCEAAENCEAVRTITPRDAWQQTRLGPFCPDARDAVQTVLSVRANGPVELGLADIRMEPTRSEGVRCAP